MVFRRLHLGTVAYGMDSMDEVQSHVFSAYTQVKRKYMHEYTHCKSLREEIHLHHLENKLKRKD